MVPIIQAIDRQVGIISTSLTEKKIDAKSRNDILLGYGDSHQRRFPLYILIDNNLQNDDSISDTATTFIALLTNVLMNQPEAIELVWVSLILASNPPETLVPLTELSYFLMVDYPKQKSKLHLDSTFRFLKQRIELEELLRTTSQKGDYKPLAFLITSGDIEYSNYDVFRTWTKSKLLNLGNFFVITSDNSKNQTALLKRIFDIVLPISIISEDIIRELFKWISQSVSLLEDDPIVSDTRVALPPPPPGFRVEL